MSGTIVLCEFPFVDKGGIKLRPCMVVATRGCPMRPKMATVRHCRPGAVALIAGGTGSFDKKFFDNALAAFNR